MRRKARATPAFPVERRLALVYVLAGVVAALAAIIYTARLGQAKADAGTGYELFAITAVVLGGTSIFGGVGQRARNVARRGGDRRAQQRSRHLPVVMRMKPPRKWPAC